MQDDFLICLDDRSGVSCRMLRLASWSVRIALVLTFIWMVKERLGLWGTTGTEAGLASLVPSTILPIGRWIAVCLELLLVLALLVGWRIRWAALVSTVVLLLHGLALCASLSPAAPVTYLSLTAASAAFLLFAVQPSASQ
jgi:uncharacterized membrane protein YphA (DoxX/SURF4 family)